MSMQRQDLRPLFRQILEVARRMSTQPRVHGNGFIQLDLEKGSRLHIWGHPALPRQKVDTGIHDHRFGFRSRVIVGRVVNAMWRTVEVDSEPTHKIYVPKPSKTENTTLQDSGEVVRARIYHSETVLAGESYVMHPRMFHETFTDRPSATLMTKTVEDHEHMARVLVPMGLEPDNDFHRDAALPCERLWEIIEEVLSCG